MSFVSKSAFSLNIIGGFRRFMLWNNENRDCDTIQMNAENVTSTTVRPSCLQSIWKTRHTKSNIESSGDPKKFVECDRDFGDLFKQRQADFVSDGTFVENGTIFVTATTGAPLTRSNVFSAPQAQNRRWTEWEEQRRQNEISKEQQAAEWGQYRVAAAECWEERLRFAAESESEQAAHQQQVAQPREDRQRLAAERAVTRLRQHDGTEDSQRNVTPEQHRVLISWVS